MYTSGSNDDLCIVYENVRNAAQTQPGKNLNASGRKSEMSIIPEICKAAKSNSASLRKQNSNVPHWKQGQNAKNENMKSIGVQTVESECVFLHNSERPSKTGSCEQTVNINSSKPQIENDECSIVFDGFQKSGKTDRCAENLTPNANVETEKKNLLAIKPKTYEEAMQIVTAFEKQNALACDNLDMEEVTLDFQPPYLHQFEFDKRKFFSKDDLKNLVSQGICMRFGRWSKNEDKILTRNWNNFVQKYSIDNPAFLLGLYQGSGRIATEVVTFRRAKKFYLQLAKDLNDRTISSVYCRARRLLDGWNYRGRFLAQELKELFRLQGLLGNRWSKIAILMNRQRLTCMNVYRYHGSKPSKGPWSGKENDLLVKAIRRCVGGKNLRTKFRGYPWQKIASFVPNRNESQCRKHWLTTLCWKQTFKECHKWKKRNDALFIYVMYTDMVEDQSFVDWDYLHKICQDCSPSPVVLQRRWYQLKQRVPDFANKDHESIVLYLYRNYLPELLRKLNISEHDLECIRKQRVKV